MLPMKTGLPGRALRLVPYLTPEEVRQLCAACRGRQQDRDALPILVLFQTGLRFSEALGLTVGHLGRQPGPLEVMGKGGKVRLVACPAVLTHRLKAFAFDRGLGPADRLSPVGRKRAWQVIRAAATRAGLGIRVYPHLLRHSDAIERLRQTMNPRALQLHLGHASPLMTMRYLSTLTAEEALRINQAVRFEDWTGRRPNPSAFFTNDSRKMKCNDSLREVTAADSMPGNGTVNTMITPRGTA
jgi:integrase